MYKQLQLTFFAFLSALNKEAESKSAKDNVVSKPELPAIAGEKEVGEYEAALDTFNKDARAIDNQWRTDHSTALNAGWNYYNRVAQNNMQLHWLKFTKDEKTYFVMVKEVADIRKTGTLEALKEIVLVTEDEEVVNEEIANHK